MKTLRRKLVICFCIARAAMSFSDTQAWAIGLNFTPSALAIENSGESVDLDIIISGLENDVQRYSFRNLSAFEFGVHYDTSDFGDYLPESGLCDILYDTDGWPSDNKKRANLSKFSCHWDMGICPSSETFALATVSFMGNGLEKDDLSFSIPGKNDSCNSFCVSLGNGHDPGNHSESAKMFLLGCGLIGLARLGGKRVSGKGSGPH
ncbi:hypothetical protein [Desulfonema magnum]|uniref:PEP-CTERM protein-sorting domain-containing protein n=1 Tax=Desulfonema magnum TaxID=45655 RepID=A0A975BJ26_9BACT|nr:hypothetical protein [Desulfonema magnum]QTA86268.1 Uncharacterized protein dnm_022890 [Desulfonema magnum]